jgi:hypothetical protein
VNSRYPDKSGSTASLETAALPGWKRRKGEIRLFNGSALRKRRRYFFAFLHPSFSIGGRPWADSK